MYYRGPGFLAFLYKFGSFPVPPPPLRSASCLSFSLFLWVAVDLIDGRWGGGRSQIIRLRERLVLYNPLTTLFGYGFRLYS
jgi:hypothetical protein